MSGPKIVPIQRGDVRRLYNMPILAIQVRQLMWLKRKQMDAVACWAMLFNLQDQDQMKNTIFVAIWPLDFDGGPGAQQKGHGSLKQVFKAI